MAENHLSDESLGRGGDDRFRLVDGEMSHVNPFEASMIDAFGKEGEETVKERGSGSINPYTGKREYQVDPISAVMLGLTLYQGYQSTKMGRESAGTQKGLVDEQLSQLDKTKDDLQGAKQGREQVASAEFDQGLQSLSAKTGMDQEDITEGFKETMNKSGLKTAAGAEQSKSKMWSRVESAFGQGQESLFGQLGAKMGDIEGWYEGEQSRIKSERQKLQSEKRLLTQQEDQKFLGLV